MRILPVCRTGILGPAFDSFEKPFPPPPEFAGRRLDVVSDASPGLVSMTNLALANWTGSCGEAVFRSIPEPVDQNAAVQVGRVGIAVILNHLQLAAQMYIQIHSVGLGRHHAKRIKVSMLSVRQLCFPEP